MKRNAKHGQNPKRPGKRTSDAADFSAPDAHLGPQRVHTRSQSDLIPAIKLVGLVIALVGGPPVAAGRSESEARGGERGKSNDSLSS